MVLSWMSEPAELKRRALSPIHPDDAHPDVVPTFVQADARPETVEIVAWFRYWTPLIV